MSLTRRAGSSSHHGDRPRGAENRDSSEDGSPARETPGQKGESRIAQQLALGDRKSGGAFVTDLRAPLNTFLESSPWSGSSTAIGETNTGLQECVLAFYSQMESARNPQECHRPWPQAQRILLLLPTVCKTMETCFPGREQARRARGFGKPGSDLASSIF